MKSKWLHLRIEAESMRRDGKSLKMIHGKLGIPLSTLSGWMKHVVLTDAQKEALTQNWKQALVKARLKASAWHREQKDIRILKAREEARRALSIIKDDISNLEIALAFLYLGEGGKTRSGLSLGNSNPTILNLYITALEKIYDISRISLYYSIHMRYDQDENELRVYWSNELNVPISKFKYTIKDPRTIGKPTRPGYYGVCLISGGPVEIQRKLMYLAEAFCERVLRG